MPKSWFLLYMNISSFLAAGAEVTEITNSVHANMKNIENFQKMTELARDLVGLEQLMQSGRVRASRLIPWQSSPLSALALQGCSNTWTDNQTVNINSGLETEQPIRVHFYYLTWWTWCLAPPVQFPDTWYSRETGRLDRILSAHCPWSFKALGKGK